MKLPPLNNDKDSNNRSVKLPNIEALNEEESKFKESIKSTGEDKKREMQYRKLLRIFDEDVKDETVLLNYYERELKAMGLYDLDKLNEAIDEGKIDLRRYDTFTLNKLIKRMVESDVKSLDSYDIKTVDDFYRYITSGELDVSQYDEEELDRFINKLINKRWNQ